VGNGKIFGGFTGGLNGILAKSAGVMGKGLHGLMILRGHWLWGALSQGGQYFEAYDTNHLHRRTEHASEGEVIEIFGLCRRTRSSSEIIHHESRYLRRCHGHKMRSRRLMQHQ